MCAAIRNRKYAAMIAPTPVIISFDSLSTKYVSFFSVSAMVPIRWSIPKINAMNPSNTMNQHAALLSQESYCAAFGSLLSRAVAKRRWVRRTVRERLGVRVRIPATTEGYRAGWTGVKAPHPGGPGRGRPVQERGIAEIFVSAGKKSIWKSKRWAFRLPGRRARRGGERFGSRDDLLAEALGVQGSATKRATKRSASRLPRRRARGDLERFGSRDDVRAEAVDAPPSGVTRSRDRPARRAPRSAARAPARSPRARRGTARDRRRP